MRRRKLGRRHNGNSRIVGKLLNGLTIATGSGLQINQRIFAAVYVIFRVINLDEVEATVSAVQDTEGFLFFRGLPFGFRMRPALLVPFRFVCILGFLCLFLLKGINRLKEEGVIVCGRRRSLLGTGLSLFR